MSGGEEERTRMIARRKRESPFWMVVHSLGSLKLAVILLAVIAAACAIATFCESNFNAKVAQAYIYKAPWFILWLGLLCINLAAAALTRWPWQRKHLGFVVTHGGIILLLIGAMVGTMAGFEAFATLRKDGPPANRLVMNETVLQVESPADGGLYLLPFETEVRAPTEAKPKVLPVPGTKTKLVIDRYEPLLGEVDEVVAATGAGGVPAVALTFSSGMMGQSMPMQLVLKDGKPVTQSFFGLARIELLPQLPAADASPAQVPDDAPLRETQVVFLNSQPVIHTHTGPPTGVVVRMAPAETGAGWVVILQGQDGESQVVTLGMTPGPPIELGAVTASIANYWPDFVMKDGQPATASDKPVNPAVLVNIFGSSDAGGRQTPVLQVAVGADGRTTDYRLSRGGKAYASGTVKAGDVITTGWADWQAHVDTVLANATTRRVVQPVSGLAATNGVPGIRARLRPRDGTDGTPVWLRSGQLEELFAEREVIRVAFGRRTRPIPFTVELLNFEVPRDEGTETPANFISTVRFKDPTTGQTAERVSKMNHPASYPGKFWNVVSGINYKFSQASWNPDDLDETTLQVLYDPGWIFKWVGSLMICAGITIMFYFKPYARKGGQKSAGASPPPPGEKSSPAEHTLSA